MTDKIRKAFPFHVLLLPLFFVWHGCNAYFGLIPFSYSLPFTTAYVGLALLVFFISWLVFRERIRAGCLTTGFLIVFFFWGAGHDWLRRVTTIPLLSSYTFLFSLVAIILVAALVYFKRKPTPPFRLNLFFNLLWGSLLLLEIVISVFKTSTNATARNNIAAQIIRPQFRDTGNKPDIYFIVFDEYMSSRGLKQYLGFDNSSIDTMLASRGFYLPANSTGNYNSTIHALAATLNLEYITGLRENEQASGLNMLGAQQTIREAVVPASLHQHGYDIVNLGIFNLEDQPSRLRPMYDNNIISVLYMETLWARIEAELWWKFSTRESFLWRMTRTTYNAAYTSSTLDSLFKETRRTSTHPRFVYAHVLLPHAPFLYLADGSMRNETGIDTSGALRDSLYIQQVLYTNSWISKLTAVANSTGKRSKVIVLGGDHGFRDADWTAATRPKQLMNYMAVYFSDHNYASLSDSLSSVNTFRIIFNKYFDTRLPMLETKTITIK